MLLVKANFSLFSYFRFPCLGNKLLKLKLKRNHEEWKRSETRELKSGEVVWAAKLPRGISCGVVALPCVRPLQGHLGCISS